MDIPGYTITRLIGQGGMASAYLADQNSLDRKVVLKVLDRSQVENPETVERFLNEGKIVASLNHPNIITIYDVGRVDDTVYISMEYVEGGDLKQRIDLHPQDLDFTLDLLRKIASGLALAHQNGIVHRDVKPGNILFRDDETPLLSDFGIAKQLQVDANLTTTGVFLGSPNYMAPEQAESGAVDGRTDIYALGCIFYEMLTAAKPYIADSVINVILEHKGAPIPTLPEEYSAYQELLSIMMAKNRNDRFRDAESLTHYLDNLITSRAIQKRVNDTDPEQVEITGDQIHVGPQAKRIEPPSAPAHFWTPRRIALGTALLTSALFFFGLSLLERYLNSIDQSAPVAVAPAMPELPQAGEPGDPVIPGVDAQPSEDEVKQALVWLGRHSLDEYRLTAPPKDNAFYYFSRLRQLDPSNADAIQGIAEIAERFAFLAERALAEGNTASAKGFISVGLQVDPNNPTLAQLKDISDRAERGLWSKLLGR